MIRITWGELTHIQKLCAVARFVMEKEFGGEVNDVATALLNGEIKDCLNDWSYTMEVVEKLKEDGFIFQLSGVSEDLSEEWHVLHLGTCWHWTVCFEAERKEAVIGGSPRECIAVCALMAKGVEVHP